MPVVGDFEVHPLGELRVFQEGRAPDETGREAFGRFRVQLVVAAGGDRDLRVRLLVVGRHAQRGAVAGQGRVEQRRRARVVELGVEAAGRTEQFADRRRAETFGVAGAEHQFVHQLEAQAVLGRELRDAGGVVGVTAGKGEVQALADVGVFQQREVELEEQLADVVLARGRQRGHAVVVAGHRQRIGLVPAFQAAVFQAGREVDRTGRQVEQAAREVGGDQGQFVLAAVAHHRLDPGQHRRGDGARAAEDVERRAAGHGRAGRRVAQGQGDVADVVAAEVGLLGLVFAEGDVDVPVQRAVGVDHAFQAGADVPGVDFLFEHARAALDRTTADQDQVGGRIEVEAERIERVQRRNEDVVGQRIARAGLGAKEPGLGRRLVGGLAAVEQHLGVTADRIAEVEAHLAEGAQAFGRRQQQVELREVEAVGGREAVVVVGARAAGLAGIEGRAAGAVVGRDVKYLVGIGVDEDEAAGRRGRAAEGHAGARHREARLGAVARVDDVLVGVAQAQEDVGAVGVPAPGHVQRLGGAVAFAVLAHLRIERQAVEILAGDDVHHAGDGVRAIQRRGAVFEHFDAVDDGQRDGVEVGRRAHARGGGFVDPAHAVDQHQHALGAQVAQVGLRGTRADAAAVRREAEVAAGVELGVERRTRAGERLHDVADRGQAAAVDVLAGDALHRHQALCFRGLDAGTGDLDAVEGLDLFVGVVLRQGHGRHQREQQRTADRQAKAGVTDGLHDDSLGWSHRRLAPNALAHLQL